MSHFCARGARIPDATITINNHTSKLFHSRYTHDELLKEAVKFENFHILNFWAPKYITLAGHFAKSPILHFMSAMNYVDLDADTESDPRRFSPDATASDNASSGDSHQCYNPPNAFLYQCKVCGNIIATRTKEDPPLLCNNCPSNGQLGELGCDVLKTGHRDLIPLFCCPVCHYHWAFKTNSTSWCSQCKKPGYRCPTIQACMYGVGWIVDEFIACNPSHLRPFAYPARATRRPVCYSRTHVVAPFVFFHFFTLLGAPT